MAHTLAAQPAFVTDMYPAVNHTGVANRPAYNASTPFSAQVTDPMSGIPIVRLTGDFGTNVLINGSTNSGLVWPHSLRPDNSGTPGRVWNSDGSMLFLDQSRTVTGDPSNSARSVLIDMSGTRSGAPGRVLRAASSPALGQGHSVFWFWDPLNPARAYVIADNGAVSEWWPVGEQGHSVGQVTQLYGAVAGYDQFRQGRAHLTHCSWDGQYYVHNCRRSSDGQRGGIRRNLLTGALGPFIPWPDPSNDNGGTDRTAQGTSGLGRYTKFTYGGRQYVVDVTNNQLMFDTNSVGLPTANWSHSDWTVINGREYLVAPVGGNGVYMIDILTGQPTRISDYATGNPNHMSNRNYKDLAETYGQVGNVTSGQRYGFIIKSNGTTERGIRAFRMDPAGPLNVVRYVANHRCERTDDSYSTLNESEAHCQASPDGRMVAFPSNWRVPGVVTDYDIHGYVALIPAAWWNPNNDGSGGGTVPAAPSGLAATAVSSSQINLSWTDNSSDETGFRIERKTGVGGTYAEIATTGASVTSYNNTELMAGTNYYYRVRATNAAGNSAYSNEANATTQSEAGTYDALVAGFTPVSYWKFQNTGTDQQATQNATITGSPELNVPTIVDLDTIAEGAPADGECIAWTGLSVVYAEAAHNAAHKTAQGTIVVTFQCDTLVEKATLVAADANSAAGGLSIEVNTNGSGRAFLKNAAGTAVVLTGVAGDIQLNQAYTQILKWGSGGLSLALYNDAGVLVRRVTNALTDGVTGTSPIRFGAWHTGVSRHDGPFGRVVWLNTRISDTAEATLARARTISRGSAVPAAPSALAATAVSSSEIALSWTDNSTNETSFRIERAPTAGGTYVEIDAVGADVTSYTDALLDPATTYYYRVRASNTSGNSTYSNEANATTQGNPPAAPSNLVATAVSNSQIDLSWMDNSSDETGFRIERATGAGGTYAEIATVGANVTSYNNTTGLAASTTYYYRIRATNANGDSDYSNEANATTQGNPPAAPSNLAATAVSSSQIDLSWTDNSSDETGFRIERATGAGGTYAEIDTVGADVTSYNNTTGLAASTTYYYRVRATNANGDSDYSNEANATTQAGATTYDSWVGSFAPNVVSYWKFQNTGTDEQGTQNATITGSPELNVPTIVDLDTIAEGASADGEVIAWSGGTGQYADAAHNAAYKTAAGTIVVTFQSDGLAEKAVLVAADANGAAGGLSVEVNTDGSPRAFLRNSSGSAVVLTGQAGDIQLDQAYTQILKWGTGGLSLALYNDAGVLVRRVTNALTDGVTGTSPIRFGAWHSDVSHHDGPFGRVVWLNRRISDTEEADLARAKTISHGGATWTTITYDDFEAGFGNYTIGGADCSLYTGATHAHQGSNAGDIQDNTGAASSFYHTTSRDVTGYTQLRASFWFKMVGMASGHDFFLEYSSDGGSTWTIVETWVNGATYANDTFYNPTVTINPGGGVTFSNNAKLRLRCDAGGNANDVYIDELRWEGL